VAEEAGRLCRQVWSEDCKRRCYGTRTQKVHAPILINLDFLVYRLVGVIFVSRNKDIKIACITGRPWNVTYLTRFVFSKHGTRNHLHLAGYVNLIGSFG
jgi:hypothetical protein